MLMLVTIFSMFSPCCVLTCVLGGENVARGSALGALLGAAHGMNGFPAWSLELKEKEAIFSEIDSF
jgi:hypothetical protein